MLSLESLGHLNYLHRLLTQPPGQWDRFYAAQSASMNFALRYQLAFASYAVALMSQATPAYRTPYVQSLEGAIEKMLDVAAWGYWRMPPPTDQEGTRPLTQSGHIAVLAGPHSRMPAGPPSDPIARDNLQYSGHLSTMLGLYEKVSGSRRYDRPFTLEDPASGARYTYTHSAVAERIHSQMLENSFGGVCCEPGMAYVPCNNYALASNALHDALHSTHYSRDNARWLRTVREKMVLRAPALRGVFGAAYLQDGKLATPVAFQFTDAWGLAFLLPFARSLVRRLYRPFRKRVTRAGEKGAYVGSSSVSEKLEISDVAINTAFGLVLARGLGDMPLADALSRYARAEFDVGWEGRHFLYRGAPRTLHSTALYALAEAVQPGGENFARLFRDPPDLTRANRPYLAEVSGAAERVGVSRAVLGPDGRLAVELRQVGAPDELRRSSPLTVILSFAGVQGTPRIKVNEILLTEESYRPDAEGRLSFAVVVASAEPTMCTITSG